MRSPALIFSLLVASTAAAEPSSFLPRAVAPEVGVSILNRTEAQRLVGKALLGEPAASAVYGEVHLYSRYPYVEARYVHVTSDAGWKRLLCGVPGEAPRAFGRAGTGPGEFGEPRGLAFAPDGRLFVADRALGRITVLRLQQQADGPSLVYAGQVDGLVQPMDVAVHDGGTPADPADDRLLVAEAGAQRVALFDLRNDSPLRLAEFGARGSADGEFLYPRAVCVGRRDGGSDSDIYVADSGNHRLVQLQLSGARLTWRSSVALPLEASSVDSDHNGNLYLTLRRDGSVWKMSPRLETLATFDGGTERLAAPRDVAIPFAWVHDHRAGETAPVWRGQGTALVLEAWGATTGVRRLDLGVELQGVQRRGDTAVDLVVTDDARLSAQVVSKSGATHHVDLGRVGSGARRVQVPGLAEAARVTLVAESSYDPARRAESTLDLAAVVPMRLDLRQNTPNPFNPTTTIAFDLPAAAETRLDIFDVAGHRVRTLVAERLEAGAHSIVWDGRDARGTRTSSGIYFYRLESGDATRVRKMVLAQ